MQFSFPWAFLLLLLLPVFFIKKRGQRKPAVAFSSVRNVAFAGFSYKKFFAFLPFAARLAALALLIIALARPRIGTEKIRDVSSGIAIAILVDRSGSMGAEMDYHGQRLTRLDVVKRVFIDFIEGDGKKLAGRPNDLTGMIAFARYADTIAPLTLGHNVLQHFLKTVDLPERREEDGTAIGDAIALGAARLKLAEETLARQTDEQADKYEIKSKVILLLSDGANNVGDFTPLDAAKQAKEWGIKIYSIGITGGGGGATVQTMFGTYTVPVADDVDEETLKAVSNLTGGKYWRAEDGRELERACEEFDKLEKSEIESIRYVDYKEAFTPFALAAFALLFLELLLNCTLFRRLP